MAIESFINIILVIVLITSILTLVLVYFVYKLIKKNKELIDKEQPRILKDAKNLIKK